MVALDEQVAVSGAQRHARAFAVAVEVSQRISVAVDVEVRVRFAVDESAVVAVQELVAVAVGQPVTVRIQTARCHWPGKGQPDRATAVQAGTSLQASA